MFHSSKEQKKMYNIDELIMIMISPARQESYTQYQIMIVLDI